MKIKDNNFVKFEDYFRKNDQNVEDIHENNKANHDDINYRIFMKNIIEKKERKIISWK